MDGLLEINCRTSHVAWLAFIISPRESRALLTGESPVKQVTAVVFSVMCTGKMSYVVCLVLFMRNV